MAERDAPSGAVSGFAMVWFGGVQLWSSMAGVKGADVWRDVQRCLR